MNIVNEIQTIKKIIEGKSITRFGDGEFYHLFNTNFKKGKGAGRQQCKPEIRSKLKEIIYSDNKFILIGISGFLAPDDQVLNSYNYYTIYMKNFIKKTIKNLNDKHTELMKRKFYSAEISRLTNSNQRDQIIILFNDFFSKNNFIFVGNKIVIKLIKNKFIDKFKSIDFYEVKRMHAYDDYDKIFNDCQKMNLNKDKIYLLSIGITATILSYDLAKLNYQAIDIGHYFELLDKIN